MPWNKDGSRKDPALYKKSGFKMKGWSAFTKPDEYEPQTKTSSRKYEDKVKKSDLDEEGKEIFGSKGYEPQTKTKKDISSDIIPQTQYPKVGETLIVKDSAERTETGKIMDADKEGSYEYDSKTKTWTKTSDTGGKRSSK